jgi:hypothetical protein
VGQQRRRAVERQPRAHRVGKLCLRARRVHAGGPGGIQREAQRGVFCVWGGLRGAHVFQGGFGAFGAPPWAEECGRVLGRFWRRALSASNPKHPKPNLTTPTPNPNPTPKKANGENNMDGESHNLSWNCGEEGPTTTPAVNRCGRAPGLRPAGRPAGWAPFVVALLLCVGLRCTSFAAVQCSGQLCFHVLIDQLRSNQPQTPCRPPRGATPPSPPPGCASARCATWSAR